MITSEKDFLILLDQIFPRKGPDLLLGRGDDCAVLPSGHEMCLTTDTLHENVHFRTVYFPPEAIGHKALAVNISDLAAMGCTPSGFLLSLVLPRGREDCDTQFYTRMLNAMAKLAQKHEMTLAGGNLCRGSHLGLTITAWGKPGKSILCRQARPGDLIFLIGEIGLARLGLEILENSPKKKHEYPEAVKSLLYPEALVFPGQVLAEFSDIRGLMDISDGLVSDLPRLVGPDFGANIKSDLKIHPEIQKFHAWDRQKTIPHVLFGGEDYALLGSISPQNRVRLLQKIPETAIIGQVTPEPGLFLDNAPLRLQGYDHIQKETEHGQ
ncbi:MAG: thiamine-phosphate kinase [Thermodesulfobacteriota bacterium]